ncbi:MAG: DNA repair protein RecO [Thermodesulfobacteriota bacterium]
MKRRGSFKTEAVVLNSIDYGESDRILTFYTPGDGKMSGIAKGARRSRRRFVGNLEPPSHISLMYYHKPGAGMVRVEAASLVDGFSGLKADIEGLARASYLLELVSEMTGEGQANPALFELLVGFLRVMDGWDGRAERDGRGAGGESLLRFFEIKLLSILGYMPHLEGCVVCRGGTDGPGRTVFSSEKGGMVCGGCARGLTETVPLSAGTARFLAMAARLDMDKLTRLVPDPALLREGERVLTRFIRHQTGKELKTVKFMEKLRAAAL